MDTIAHYQREYDRRSAALPGEGLVWLERSRREAMAHFVARGFPKPREEKWKYTRTNRIERHLYNPSDDLRTVDEATTIASGLGMPGQRVVFVNGRFQAHLSKTGKAGSRSIVLPLAEALKHHADRLETVLNKIADPTAHAFSALNTALNADGVFIDIAPGDRLDTPLTLLFVADSAEDFVTHPRIVVRMGADSSLDLVEHFVAAQGKADTSADDSADSKAANYFTNAVTEICVGPGARLEHYLLQQESLEANHVHTLAVNQAAHSQYTLHAVSFGAALARHDINVNLHQPHAGCALNGLYFISGRQHVDFHTTIDHAVPDCRSREDFKGMLMGSAHGVFNGRVLVRADAQRTDSAMSNHNLLLSDAAEIDTKPELEIYADDVKCSHGATIGQLDEAMLFYLRTRGVPEHVARALLTHGFGQDLIERMHLQPVKNFVVDTLLDALPHAAELRSIMS